MLVPYQCYCYRFLRIFFSPIKKRDGSKIVFSYSSLNGLVRSFVVSSEFQDFFSISVKMLWNFDRGFIEFGEKAMAPHSSTLAWKIPWTEEPGRLQSMGSLRVGLDWVTSLSLFTFMHWRRTWQPTQVFLPGESQGQGSLVGCRLWGRTESDTTEAT